MDIVLQDTGARRSGSLTVLNAHGDFCAGQKEATEHTPPPPGYWCRRSELVVDCETNPEDCAEGLAAVIQ